MFSRRYEYSPAVQVEYIINLILLYLVQMYVQYYVLPFPPKGMVYPSGPLLPTFILILLHSIERVGGSLKDKYRALFWNMCSVLRVRIAVLQYCTVAPACCPVVIGVLYTVSSFVRYSLCLWRGLPPFVPTKDYYLGRYSRVTCSLGSFTVHSVQPRT